MAYILHHNDYKHPKKRMQQHDQDVRKLFFHDLRTDSFASHFGKLVPKPLPPEKKVQDFVLYDFEILWKGNPLSTVKTFGTRACKLCAQERLAILQASRGKNYKYSINKCSEIYGACHHKPAFHRYKKQPTASTDESIKDEKVPTSTRSDTTEYSIEMTETPRGFLIDQQVESDIYDDPAATPVDAGWDLAAAEVTDGSLNNDDQLLDFVRAVPSKW